ncbi:Hypothetical_protein [Hexamita inflata]|uniref:Hypothetical_protein n=1 Tax=Hexamita inflata TaxID=28002 RepID=A0AA86U6N2_9EUKA|nr:Hypothetical protein HINF_LOCUS32565 [Hexamita inflata]
MSQRYIPLYELELFCQLFQLDRHDALKILNKYQTYEEAQQSMTQIKRDVPWYEIDDFALISQLDKQECKQYLQKRRTYFDAIWEYNQDKYENPIQYQKPGNIYFENREVSIENIQAENSYLYKLNDQYKFWLENQLENNHFLKQQLQNK